MASLPIQLEWCLRVTITTGINKDANKIAFIEQLWRADRLIVVGFSFSDPFLIRVAESTLRALPSDNRHFAFIGVKSGQSITSHDRRRFGRKYRLSPLFYEVRTNETGEDHSALIRLLSMLTDEGFGKNPVKSTGTGGPSQELVIAAERPEAPTTGQAASREFERSLLVSPGGRTLYVEPRLLRPGSLDHGAENAKYEPIDIAKIIKSAASFIISTRAEYGSTTLCRRLVKDLIASGAHAVYRDAEILPNNKRQLRQDLPQRDQTNTNNVVVLDSFNVARHERLLKELIGLEYFNRIILVLKSIGNSPSTSLSDGAFGINFESIILSYLDRGDIRTLAANLFDSSDAGLISTIVEKVYDDLLALCIPLTPANVIMYLTILYKEGDFSPLNRVQIVDRYLHELLRRPGDAYRESFGTKNKIDVISAFVYSLYIEGRTICTEADWFTFCRNHMEGTLSAFDDKALLSELLATRVLVSAEGHLVFKYRFFYSYFLGRHVANRGPLLAEFVSRDAYLAVEGVVEVITAVSADNVPLVNDIVAKLENALVQLDERYPLKRSDPFAKIEWPAGVNEEERLWQPVAAALAAGPPGATEVDKLKRSILAERRTENQSVILFEFDKLEGKVTAYFRALIDAINSSDFLDATTKKSAH
jgi:hypothetical protein